MNLRTYTFDERKAFITGKAWPIVHLDQVVWTTRFPQERPFAPGDYVMHSNGRGFGMIVAHQGPDLLVLWSQEPASDWHSSIPYPASMHVRVEPRNVT